jgi:hypothetical protein
MRGGIREIETLQKVQYKTKKFEALPEMNKGSYP